MNGIAAQINPLALNAIKSSGLSVRKSASGAVSHIDRALGEIVKSLAVAGSAAKDGRAMYGKFRSGMA